MLLVGLASEIAMTTVYPCTMRQLYSSFYRFCREQLLAVLVLLLIAGSSVASERTFRTWNRVALALTGGGVATPKPPAHGPSRRD